MVLLILGIFIIGGVVFFIVSEKEKTKRRIEDVIIDNMIEVKNSDFLLEEKLNTVNHLIFQYCLKKSKKNDRYEEVLNPTVVMQNPRLLKYTAIFSAIKEVTSELKKPKFKSVAKEQERDLMKESFYSITNYAIEEINNF